MVSKREKSYSPCSKRKKPGENPALRILPKATIYKKTAYYYYENKKKIYQKNVVIYLY
ncbi:hypothetical protein BSG1_08551 [Bacillus sp. SG-1]|nr:hypothetical protein BSG1_08551 [Bacillus sp. SG-1]